MHMDCTVIRTLAHKEAERTLRLDKRPAWACFFVEDATGRRIGVRFTWLDGPWACSPDEHFTEDGRTYRRVSSTLRLPGLMMEKEIGEPETSDEKLASLERLMGAYQDSLGFPVFGS